jgi:hypothetical protein
MQEKDTRSVAEIEADTDRAILAMILTDPVLWKDDEIVREMDHPLDAQDGLRRLCATGLLHRVDDEFYCLTRAAARADALDELDE